MSVDRAPADAYPQSGSFGLQAGVAKAHCKVLVYFSLPFIFVFLAEASGNSGSSPNAPASCFHCCSFSVTAAIPDGQLVWWPHRPCAGPRWRLRQSLGGRGNWSRDKLGLPSPCLLTSASRDPRQKATLCLPALSHLLGSLLLGPCSASAPEVCRWHVSAFLLGSLKPLASSVSVISLLAAGFLSSVRCEGLPGRLGGPVFTRPPPLSPVTFAENQGAGPSPLHVVPTGTLQVMVLTHLA